MRVRAIRKALGFRARLRPYTTLAHARHFRAAAGIVSRHSGQVLVGGPAGSGAVRSIAFVIVNTTNATITKSTIEPMNVPYAIAFATEPLGWVLSTNFASRHPPPGNATLITGIRMSLTSELTTLPTAPPMM